MEIILASQSPYKKHALDILDIPYKTIPSNFNESSIKNKNPKTLANILSKAKAKKIGQNHKNAVIIASDLFVVLNNKILEKPKDKKEALKMLNALSEKKFDIVTGLAVYNTKTKNMLSAVETCTVTFRKLDKYEINNYIKKYPVLKCAAAFESDGLLRFAKHINGNYNFRAAIPVNKLPLPTK